MVAVGEGWVFRLEGPHGRAVSTGVLRDPAAVLNLRAAIDQAIARALAEGWEVDPTPRLRPVRPRRETSPVLLAPVYAMDRRFANGARRRRYVIRVNAAGWFRTQVWINGTIHRTTECYTETDVRRLTRQFDREVADVIADGWAEVSRVTCAPAPRDRRAEAQTRRPVSGEGGRSGR